VTTTDTPVDVAELGTAFCSAKILLSALELGLFTELAGGPATEAELRARLGLHARASADFFDALVALGLLARDGELYRNSAIATEQLVRGPDYQGGFLEGANFVLYPAWGQLTTALRTGQPQAQGTVADALRDPRTQLAYLAMQDSLSAPLAADLTTAIDWSGYRTVADIGGARGNLASLLLTALPHLTGHVFDQPANGGPFADHVRMRGVAERIGFTGGDLFRDPFPSADVLVIGHVLADFSLAERKSLVAKAYQAVTAGGTLLVYDPMTEPDRPEVGALVASLHMLLMSDAGQVYPTAECRELLLSAGFVDVDARRIARGNTLVIGRKS